MPDITPGSMAGKPPVITTPTVDATKPKRGRPPGAPNKAPSAASTSQDVRQAAAALESMYGLIGAGLFMAGFPVTATKWASATDDLTESNKEALAASPKLAKWIANTGQTGGAATLIMTHAVAFGSVALAFREEKALKDADKPKREPKPRPKSAEQMDVIPEQASATPDDYDPTLIR